jgi:CubicO group peptidase (beta-lactamase class C family)
MLQVMVLVTFKLKVCRILTIWIEIISVARSRPKVFEVNDRSTYSNVAFSLLGLALERTTGKPYSEIISSSILQPLGMNQTTTTKPKDSAGIIPWGPNDWRRDLDADAPYVSFLRNLTYSKD